jgi:tetratricopeptide (TPR) repeat protein
VVILCRSIPVTAEVLTEEEWLDLGWDYFNAGNIDEAFNVFLQTVDDYPESAEAHLALGEIYIEMGLTERGRTEMLLSLRYDDTSPLAARAHFNYALIIREEDPWQALLHLDRAHHLGGSPGLQFEIAHQTRFCHLLLQMQENAASGPVVLHYADYLLTQSEAETLAVNMEASLYLAETFCSFEVTEPLHVFLYASERAVRAEIRLEEDDNDPAHREYHIPYEADLEFLPYACMQVVTDLQDELNRHAGAQWVVDSMPYAIKGTIEMGQDALAGMEDGTINIDDAVRALMSGGVLVDLTYVVSDEYGIYVPDSVRYAELGSFLDWIRRTKPIETFQEIITQPNLEIVLDNDIDTIQREWTDDLMGAESLLSDPELADTWASEQPLSPFSGDPDLPLNILKEGLRLYLDGEVVNGLWEIRRAIDMDPGMALGYYTLGWIAIREDDYDEAEEQLGMAVRLFEDTSEIAWCHAMLAPIYMLRQRWDLAHGSLNYVMLYASTPNLQTWAENLRNTTSHILALRPSPPLDQSSVEARLMYTFFQNYSQALNDGHPVEEYIGSLMNSEHARDLVEFYETVREYNPDVRFNHVVQAVGQSGSAFMVEVRLYGDFPGYRPILPPELAPLLSNGYLMYFQVMPDESSWVFLDWESGWFPIPEFQEFEEEAIQLPTEQDQSRNPYRD